MESKFDKLYESIMEGKLNESAKLKKLSKEMDSDFRGLDSDTINWFITGVEKGALTDSNYHDESKKLDKKLSKLKDIVIKKNPKFERMLNLWYDQAEEYGVRLAKATGWEYDGIINFLDDYKKVRKLNESKDLASALKSAEGKLTADEVEKILSKPNVKKAIEKVNVKHKPTKDAPNKFGSAGHQIDMRGTLKRYFKVVGASERELARIAGYVIDGSKLTEGVLKPLNRDDKAELLNIWHTSKIHSSKRMDRLKYTVDQFLKQYPNYNYAGVYKHLTREV